MAITNHSVKDTYWSWYFDTTTHSILYGVTVWQATGDYQTTVKRTTNGSSVSSGVNNLRIDLIDSQVGFTTGSEITELISHYSRQHVNESIEDKILFENKPEMNTISKALKKSCNPCLKIALVTREGLISEQVLRYQAMLNQDRFYVPDSVLIKPDLIFDDITLTNLIDPIQSDEQTRFPLTESLLIAFSHLENSYMRYSSACSIRRHSYDHVFGQSMNRRSIYDSL